MLLFCIANNVNETNVIRNRHACKKNFLLVHSTVVDTTFDASLMIPVMVPVDAGFLGGLSPSLLLGQPLHCTSHLGLDCHEYRQTSSWSSILNMFIDLSVVVLLLHANIHNLLTYVLVNLLTLCLSLDILILECMMCKELPIFYAQVIKER